MANCFTDLPYEACIFIGALVVISAGYFAFSLFLNSRKPDRPDAVSSVTNEFAKRAPVKLVLENWRPWHFGLFVTFLSMFLAALGTYLSLHFSDWGVLSRFGAIEVILGSFLIGRPMWRRRFKSRFATLTLTEGGAFTKEQTAEYVMERTDIWFFYLGFFIAALGSVVWGFADLLNCL